MSLKIENFKGCGLGNKKGKAINLPLTLSGVYQRRTNCSKILKHWLRYLMTLNA